MGGYSDKKVVGIKHISCDSKSSCTICKAFNSKIYRWPEDELLIPQLPLHPNCKCRQEKITDKKCYMSCWMNSIKRENL